MSLPVLVEEKVSGWLLFEYWPESREGSAMYVVSWIARDEETRRNVIKDVMTAYEPWTLSIVLEDKKLDHLPLYHTDLLHRIVTEDVDTLGFSEFVEIACSHARCERESRK